MPSTNLLRQVSHSCRVQAYDNLARALVDATCYETFRAPTQHTLPQISTDPFPSWYPKSLHSLHLAGSLNDKVINRHSSEPLPPPSPPPLSPPYPLGLTCVPEHEAECEWCHGARHLELNTPQVLGLIIVQVAAHGTWGGDIGGGG